MPEPREMPSIGTGPINDPYEGSLDGDPATTTDRDTQMTAEDAKALRAFVTEAGYPYQIHIPRDAAGRILATYDAYERLLRVITPTLRENAALAKCAGKALAVALDAQAAPTGWLAEVERVRGKYRKYDQTSRGEKVLTGAWLACNDVIDALNALELAPPMTDPLFRGASSPHANLLADFRAYCRADARLQADAEASARLRGDKPNPAPMPPERPFARPEPSSRTDGPSGSQPPREASPECAP